MFMTREHMTNFCGIRHWNSTQILDFNEKVLIMSLHAVKCVVITETSLRFWKKIDLIRIKCEKKNKFKLPGYNVSKLNTHILSCALKWKQNVNKQLKLPIIELPVFSRRSFYIACFDGPTVVTSTPAPCG